MHWFWHPNRIGVTLGPDRFRKQLQAIDANLEVTWDRYQETWLIWTRNYKIKTPLCAGWMLLFPVCGEGHSYMPLDERVFARLYHASADRWGNGRYYFDAIAREQERDKAKAKADSMDETRYKAGEYFEYMQIKNYGKGSKFVNHFSG
jgi:hypothetical protein